LLKYSDDLAALAEAYKNDEVVAEDLHVHLAPRLEVLPESDSRRLLNDVELASYTLAEPDRRARVLEILAEAQHIVEIGTQP
jgi:hypothetical protein